MAIEKSLKMDLPALAEMLRAKGRGKDTMLAHITPKEAALLKRRGGRGSTNPDTGLPEFEDSGDYTSGAVDFNTVAPVSPAYDTISGSGGQYTYAPGSTAAFAEAQKQQDFQQTPAQPYTDQTLYPGGVQPDTRTTQTVFTPSGQSYNIPTGQYVAPSPTAPGVVSPDQQAAPTDKPGTLDKLKEYLTSEKGVNTLSRLGLTAGLGAFGASQARKAGAQTQAATAEQKAIAQPYTQQGQQLVAQAQQGTLSPASQQALDAAKAQVNQGIANRGGVGSQQASNQIGNLYQSLLDNQYKYGLQIMQIGDNITLGAIKSGLQLDQQLQTTTNNFYAQLASIAAGGTGYIPAAPALQTQGIK